MIDAVDALDDIARKYNGQYGKAIDLDDDPVALSVIYSAMEREFGSFAENSFQGVQEKAIRRATKIMSGQDAGGGLMSDVADLAADKLLGRNEANALKSFNELLRD
jgi:hypothetical protein